MLRTVPVLRDAETVAGVRPMTLGEARTEIAIPSDVAISVRGESGDDAPISATPIPRTLVSGSPPPASARRAEVGEAASRYRAGTLIAGRYRLERPLGRGGMGEVWSAHHVGLNTEVAVKFLSVGLGGREVKVALERFRFEAQISAHLSQRTTHVVAVHDAGSDLEGPYLVMDCVRGRTLRAALNQGGPLAPAAVAELIEQVAEALSVAHDAGIVHRDLKPGNILLLDGRPGGFFVKVADFGIAKAMRDDLVMDRPEETTDGWMLGSPAYMSPEQIEGRGVDKRTDLWALGVIVYEALTGRLPFPGRTLPEIINKMSTDEFIPPTSLRPSLSPKIDAFCRRALARRKEDRFATVEELVNAYRLAITRRPPRFPSLGRTAISGAFLVVAILGLRPAPSEAGRGIGARSRAIGRDRVAMDRPIPDPAQGASRDAVPIPASAPAASPITPPAAEPVPPPAARPPARPPAPRAAPITPRKKPLEEVF